MLICFRVFDSKAFFGILSWIKGTVCAKHRNGDGRTLSVTAYAVPDSPFCRCATSSPGRGKSFLKGTPLDYARNFTATAKSRPLGEGGKAVGFDGRGTPRAKPSPTGGRWRVAPDEGQGTPRAPYGLFAPFTTFR